MTSSATDRRPWSVVLAPDSFKGSIAADRVARTLAAGWAEVRPGDELILKPMADGGEGTLDAFEAAVPGARRMPVTVPGPDDAPIESSWLLLPATGEAAKGTAVVELASTSGIELLGSERRPWSAHTRGFGRAIAAALDHGISRLILGIGSSASTDAGIGLLTELGARFVDAAGEPVPDGAAGLSRVATAELSGLHRMPEAGVVVLSDVTNPLTGPRGAAAVFGPQKGLVGADIAEVDAALVRLAELIPADPDTPGPDTPGAGAAGGVGFALLTWGAPLVPGAVAVSELIDLPAVIRDADLVITGEGSYDGQSASGKAPDLVTRTAHALGVRVGLVAGRIDRTSELDRFAALVSLSELAGSSEAAIASPETWLRQAGQDLAATLTA
ncbi:MAG: glycerate kinase [Microlunatus sp.]